MSTKPKDNISPFSSDRSVKEMDAPLAKDEEHANSSRRSVGGAVKVVKSKAKGVFRGVGNFVRRKTQRKTGECEPGKAANNCCPNCCALEDKNYHAKRENAVLRFRVKELEAALAELANDKVVLMRCLAESAP